ncbi:pancreatic lipase-related protein 2-like [Wyeomyia smithii]|uniref:pancreatic lipase-related protein 2-like n=1 Tax=Wyeomyia smithii TaxID=174621 RepID=UPI002468023A|nr:pancreatic lipase-related protein 2-like [Wyeomyia smithii]
MAGYIQIILIGLLTAAAALPLDQSWQLVPNADGFLHLVNINPYNLPDVDPNEPVPTFVPEEDIVFRLFTRSNPTAHQLLQIGNPSSITGSNFNSAHQTRFTIHGWGGGGHDGTGSGFRNALLAVGDFNVITVDWSVAAGNPNYIAARNQVGPAGTGVSLLIDDLIAYAGADPNDIYVTGHSLGGHVAANAGKGQGGRLHTIISLDPAGPLFSAGQDDALSPQDAQYVETIMTNAGLLGIGVPLGQANFYPNGGRTQPGCGIDISGNCAHGLASTFYIESIGSTVPFRSTRCASHDEILEGVCTPSGPDANMGGEPSNHGRGVEGIFFLTTNAESPFAQG